MVVLRGGTAVGALMDVVGYGIDVCFLRSVGRETLRIGHLKGAWVSLITQ